MIIVASHPTPTPDQWPTTTRIRPRSGKAPQRWQNLVKKIITLRHMQHYWHVLGTFLNRDVSDFIRKRLSEIWLGKKRIHH